MRLSQRKEELDSRTLLLKMVAPHLVRGIVDHCYAQPSK
jgi:hypothetical protein